MFTCGLVYDSHAMHKALRLAPLGSKAMQRGRLFKRQFTMSSELKNPTEQAELKRSVEQSRNTVGLFTRDLETEKERAEQARSALFYTRGALVLSLAYLGCKQVTE